MIKTSQRNRAQNSMPSTATLYRSSLGKKYIMSATGGFLGLFLLIHTLGNSTLFFGRAWFNSYAEHLHSLGPLVTVFELVLLIVFLLHIMTGLILFFQNNRARQTRYSVSATAGRRTWGSRTMPYTGICILLFVLVHLFNFHFTDHSRPIADIVSPVLSRPLYAVFYMAAMLLLALHITHGFWSMFQSLGLYHPGYNCLIRRSTLWLARFIALVFLMIPLLFLVGHAVLQ